MPRPSMPAGFSRKKSKLKQKSKTRKSCFVVVRTEQLRTESRAAPDHLPELDLRVDRLEEDQVRYLGNVDAGVEHVDRDGDVRRVVLL